MNVVRVPPVSMAGLVIYLTEVCNWKDDAVRHYQVTVTNSLAKRKGHLCDVKIHKSLCQLYLRVGWIYQEDIPEKDTISDLGASEHRWEGAYVGLVNVEGKFKMMIFTINHVC